MLVTWIWWQFEYWRISTLVTCFNAGSRRICWDIEYVGYQNDHNRHQHTKLRLQHPSPSHVCVWPTLVHWPWSFRRPGLYHPWDFTKSNYMLNCCLFAFRQYGRCNNVPGIPKICKHHKCSKLCAQIKKQINHLSDLIVLLDFLTTLKIEKLDQKV